jgi:hypothetical protein
MKETALTFEVHCLQPRWIEHEKARYRIYVNDDLITERTWIWDMDTVIEESMQVKVTPNLTHNIRLEHVKFNRGDLAQFGLRNFHVNSWPKPDHGGHGDSLSFMIA